MADAKGNNAPSARAEHWTTVGGEALAEIIAAQTQPANATHLSLPGAEYLAEGDVHISKDTRRASPPPGARVFRRTVHLEAAHMRLQEILAETDHEHAVRFSAEEITEELDDQTRKLEEEVYLTRETMSIDWLRQKQVPLLYDPNEIPILNMFYKHEQLLPKVRPFYLHPPLDFDAPIINFFERQCLRFHEFNRWQAYNRDIDIMQEDDMNKAYRAALVREATSGREWREFMANPELAHSAGRKEEFWNRRREERTLLHDDKCDNFDQYEAGVRARLVRNGVQVPARFALLNEFWAQDRLTMWAEYVAFEHWHMEQMSDDVEDWQVKHDASYEELQRKVALGAHETAEYLASNNGRLQRRVERDRAFYLYDRAALELARLEKRPRAQNHEQMLDEARAKLKAAEAAKNAVVRHEEAIEQYLHETETYREACDIKERHVYLLDWVKDQHYDMLAEVGELAPRSAPRVSFVESRPATPSESPEIGRRAHVADPGEQQQLDDTEARPSSQEGPQSMSLEAALSLATGPPVRSSPVRWPPVQLQPMASPPTPSESATSSPAEASSPEEPPAADTLPVEEDSVEQPQVKEPSVKRPTIERPGNQLPAVGQPTILAPAPPGLRRSPRIAAMRQRAAEQAALQSTQASGRSESVPRAQAVSRGSRSRKRGRGKMAAEQAKDAKPPAKRTRRRTVRK